VEGKGSCAAMDLEDAEKAKMRRIIPRCVGEELRALYANTAKEAIPTRLAVLVQRLADASSSLERERQSRDHHLRQHSI
jgi:rRNA-processing protein FCF1